MATPSMLIVPDRYKSGVLYSQLPESGAVDLDVTRATTAFRTNASGILESVASGVPRLDYPAAGGCPALLVEPAATNLALRSQEFDNAYYVVSGVTVSANTSVAPDGTTTMDRITETATTGTHFVRTSDILLSGNAIRTSSVFVKKGTVRYIQLINNAFSGSNSSAIFDLDTKTVTDFRASSVGGPIFTYISSKVEDFGNGILRISLTNQSSADNTQIIVAHSNVATFAAGTLVNGTISYAGSISNNTDVWGAQLEVGSVATSYIPTVAATATRNADVISKTGVSGFIGQTQGTLYAEVDFRAIGQARRVLCLSDNSVSNRILIGFESSNNLRALVTTGGATQFLSETLRTTGIYKIAVGYALNDFVLYVNGAQVATDNSGTVPACNSIFLGKQEDATSNLFFNDRIRAAAIYTTRLSNTELASLTSL
jgi:hypothetical protein